jgi:hypothetical protein
MEKPTNEERVEEQEERVNLRDLSNEQLQAGIDLNLNAMLNQLATQLTVLEEMIGRPIDVNTNAFLPDGRKLHLRIR